MKRARVYYLYFKSKSHDAHCNKGVRIIVRCDNPTTDLNGFIWAVTMCWKVIKKTDK